MLNLLSVVIPARDEEGCIASTVQHLHLELRLKNVPHEIVVVMTEVQMEHGRFYRLFASTYPSCCL